MCGWEEGGELLAYRRGSLAGDLGGVLVKPSFSVEYRLVCTHSIMHHIFSSPNKIQKRNIPAAQ
jgi:hypothetical protein